VVVMVRSQIRLLWRDCGGSEFIVVVVVGMRRPIANILAGGMVATHWRHVASLLRVAVIVRGTFLHIPQRGDQKSVGLEVCVSTAINCDPLSERDRHDKIVVDVTCRSRTFSEASTV
jgi:Na+(H+)/acetate symporter ActP